MIKECKEMYVDGIALNGINKDFLKGKKVFNGSSKVEGCHFGIVKGFHIAGPENKTHAGLRFLVVETLDTKENRNWWIDLKDGLNPDLYVIDEDIELSKNDVIIFNYEDIYNGTVYSASFSDKDKAREFMKQVQDKLLLKYGDEVTELGSNVVEVDEKMIYAYILNSTMDSKEDQQSILDYI